MTDQENKTAPRLDGRPAKDRWAKLGFLAVVLVVAGTVYFSQREDPKLEGWGIDLQAALRDAKSRRAKVVVLFTAKPMGQHDKDMVKKCMRVARTVNALAQLGYAKVHLTMRDNKSEVERYNVAEPPTVLLLDADGRMLKGQQGFMIDLDFCNDFLGAPSKATQEKG
jgi:hypothetical protein